MHTVGQEDNSEVNTITFDLYTHLFLKNHIHTEDMLDVFKLSKSLLFDV